jgi:hypothetical protein
MTQVKASAFGNFNKYKKEGEICEENGDNVFGCAGSMQLTVWCRGGPSPVRVRGGSNVRRFQLKQQPDQERSPSDAIS